MPKLIYVLHVVCAIYVIVEVWSKQRSWSDASKILWTVAALFFSIITALVYYVTTRRKF